jgi:glycosyltransferase involved in cell wall biosynthesis
VTGRIGVALVIVRLGRGGAERALVSLANRLDPERFRPHVIAIRDAGELASELAPHVRLHVLGRRRALDFASLRRFAVLLAAEQVEIVHTHSHLSAYFARLARAAGRSPWRHVLHLHYPLIRRSRYRFVDRLLLCRVDHVFAASRDLRSYAVDWLKLAPERCEWLPNGVEIGEERRSARSRPPTVLQVARVEPQKDQRLALDVASRLRDEGVELRWLFVGRNHSAYAGDVRREASRLGLDELVRFVGEHPRPHDLLDQAEVGVLTSRGEGLPLALLEYMAAGLPVVATDVGDAGTVVRSAEGGWVVPAGDAPAFAAALRSCLRDPAAAEAAGAAGRRYVQAHHSVAAMVHRVEDVYAALVT